ncbi:MAG: phage shock protein operon transcriptional activator [Gammaproteobacteria bacterium]|nr:phage shock protein operon transcriptional activator [Gammaproteobacteria bacterium]
MPLNEIQLIGESPSFLKVLEEVSTLAELEKPVLLVGERGTGKELFAARLHFLSKRWDSVYLQVNCASLTETLLESELFGHEAGSFTGAMRKHMGRFERAHTGTLFLDELATASMRVQEKILRVIEYGEFERVGGTGTIQTNVRIVAATNEDLPTLARAGKFREDLLDRLAFDVITLPPLRSRKEDILLLAEHFAIGMANELGRDVFPGFADAAKELLENYDWPGNVRQLKNVVERAVYRNDPDELVDGVIVDPFESPYRLNGSASASTSDNWESFFELPMDLKKTLEDLEIQAIEKALVEAKHNQRRVAENLGLTYHQLRNLLRKYSLSTSRSTAE